MICTYYADIRCLEREALFQEKVKQLSPYRQQKIAILRHEKDKNRSLGAGLLLDHGLAVYGLQERSVEYEIGEWGKPTLKYHPEICFSLSHSGDYAICTIGDRPVGNDIECIKEGRLKVADRFFAKEELDWLYEAGTQDERTLSDMRECGKCAKRHSERNKKKYEERKAQHKCVRCGKDLPEGYSIFECEDCRKKRKAWMWGE